MRQAIFLCLALSACAPTPEFVEQELEGGRALGACDWPSVGQIDSACTATLIGARWILSAAHCPTGARFRAGGVEVGILRCVRHPDFESSRRVFDFMVCELDTPIEVPIVPLMTPCEAAELNALAGERFRALPEGRAVFVVGMGAPASGTKRGVAMEVASAAYASPALIAFEDPMDLGGSRPGDSGGPTFLAMADGTWRQVGVHHEGGFGSRVLDVFVPAAVDWIETTTALDATPCHLGSTWMPTDACAELPTEPEGGGGSFPACVVATAAPRATCMSGTDAGWFDAALADAGEAMDVGPSSDTPTPDASFAATDAPDAAGDGAEGGVPAVSAGCGCRVGRAGSMYASSGLSSLLVLIAWRRRRERRVRCRPVHRVQRDPAADARNQWLDDRKEGARR